MHLLFWYICVHPTSQAWFNNLNSGSCCERLELMLVLPGVLLTYPAVCLPQHPTLTAVPWSHAAPLIKLVLFCCHKWTMRKVRIFTVSNLALLHCELGSEAKTVELCGGVLWPGIWQDSPDCYFNKMLWLPFVPISRSEFNEGACNNDWSVHPESTLMPQCAVNVHGRSQLLVL